MVPGAESFIERRHRDRMKPHGTDSVSSVLARSHSLPLPLPPLHSAEAVTGWMASRWAVVPLKAEKAAMSQLWGDSALPLPGCHVGPVTKADVVALYPM